jgi:hypothetical protein
VVAAPDYGIVTKLPHRVLVDIAQKADCVLELVAGTCSSCRTSISAPYSADAPWEGKYR